MTSWLVAPQCTQTAASPPTAWRSARTSGSAGVPAERPCLQQLVDVVQVGVTAIDDRCSRLGRDHVDGRLALRKRALDFEHRLEPRVIGDGVEELLGDEERPECRHTRKKAVCPSPWRWMSKRSPPSSGWAIKVARSTSASSESTGSAALASSSSGK